MEMPMDRMMTQNRPPRLVGSCVASAADGARGAMPAGVAETVGFSEIDELFSFMFMFKLPVLDSSLGDE
jgi:hypothetical protein